jgi:hypothetical protein
VHIGETGRSAAHRRVAAEHRDAEIKRAIDNFAACSEFNRAYERGDVDYLPFVPNLIPTST